MLFFREQAFELEAERERKLLNSRIAQLESDLKIKESAELEVRNKLIEAVEAMEKVIYVMVVSQSRNWRGNIIFE